jgi:hypothetical protein
MTLRQNNLDRYRWLGQSQGDGLSMVFAPGYEWRLGTNATLFLYLSGANQCGYSIAYFFERD